MQVFCYKINLIMYNILTPETVFKRAGAGKIKGEEKIYY